MSLIFIRETYLQASAIQSAAIYIEIVQLLFTVSKILFILVRHAAHASQTAACLQFTT